MKIAICNETYRDWPLEQAFRHASDTGYDGIEIAPFTLHKDAFQITADQINQVASLARKYRLEVVGLHWLLAFTEGLHVTSPDPQVRIRTAGYLSRLAKVCQRMGGKLMVLGSPQQRNMAEGISVKQANQLAIDCIRRTLPALRRHGVTLALEPLGPEEGNFLLTAEWGRHLVEALDSPFVGLHLDVKAMSTETIPAPQIISASRDCLLHFHCNDPNRRGPGMGSFDYRPVIEALLAAGYDRWLSVEVFDEDVPPETTAVESLRYLRQVLAA
jgi:sugar phosphate isomerase/epimerase